MPARRIVLPLILISATSLESDKRGGLGLDAYTPTTLATALWFPGSRIGWMDHARGPLISVRPKAGEGVP